MMNDIIFVGWINKGNTPVDGETTKNQYIIAELEKYCNITALDFYQKNRHPWIYLQALWALISKPKATIILSTSAKNVYATLKMFKKLRIKRSIIHWVIGGAFGKIITSLVEDIIMPPLGLLIGGINFKDLKCVLKDAYTDAAGNLQDAVTINYGNFIQVTLDLLLVAASIFLVIRLINKVKDKVIKKEEEPAADPAPTKEEVLLTEIRDLLKQK